MKPIPLLKKRMNKRGIALESAILFMTIIFSCCFLLTSLALWGHQQVKLEDAQIQVFVEREQIGEHFITYLDQAIVEAEAETETGPEDFEAFLAENNIVYGNYTCEEIRKQDADMAWFELIVRRGSRDDATVVLYIKAVKTAAGQVSVLSWLNSVPETVDASSV